MKTQEELITEYAEINHDVEFLFKFFLKKTKSFLMIGYCYCVILVIFHLISIGLYYNIKPDLLHDSRVLFQITMLFVVILLFLYYAYENVEYVYLKKKCKKMQDLSLRINVLWHTIGRMKKRTFIVYTLIGLHFCINISYLIFVWAFSES